MKKYRLKISGEDYEELKSWVFEDMPKEAGAFALAGVAETKDTIDIIIRRPVKIPKGLFIVQNEVRLEVAPKAINGLISLCEANQSGAIVCHSHPGEFSYSASDNFGEKRIFDALRPFIPVSAPTASLLFTPEGLEGRVWLPNHSQPISIPEIIIVDRFIKKLRQDQTSNEISIDDIYDRQVRAFGKPGQRLIKQARVGIVGVGGTGSPVAEQLVRMGTEDLILIDPDDYDSTNVTRVYGTYAASIRKSLFQFFRNKPVKKVDLVARNLRKINPNARIQAISKNVVLSEVLRQLLDRDVVFLCTDDHWGRSIVNELAYQYFIPTINLGCRIASKNGNISAAVGVVDVLRPDKPCLWCSQVLNADRIATESMPMSKRQQLLQEGYVEDLNIKNPSVISITTAISGMAVSLYLQLLTDFMGDSGNISRLNYDVLNGMVRRGTSDIRDKCRCKVVRGFGDLKPTSTVNGISFLNG